jgi:hypothetical protein
VNFELDSLKAIWYTLHDTVQTTVPQANWDPAHTRLGANAHLIAGHIRTRVAQLQVGARAGWKTVPGSEIQRSLIDLNVTAADALTLSSTIASHSFRGSKSGKRHHRSKKSS